LPARSTLRVEYHAFITVADRIPESLTWGGTEGVQLS
jgi:hypothetical protein